MVFEGLQARLGMGRRQRRFVDVESARDLDDISDPETKTDESALSIREWADRHPAAAIVLGLGTLLALGLFARWGAKFAFGILRSPWTYAALGALVILGITFRKGWSRRDSQVTSYDELQLKIGGSSKAFKGTRVELPGKANAFVPIKGWSGIFSSPRPYTNDELAAGLGESFDPTQVDQDSAATILLEPGEFGSLVGVSDTEWGGKKIVQETGGLKPHNGNYTSLKCTLPEFEDDRVDGLRKQNEQMAEDLRDAREENAHLKRRNENLKERMSDPINEELDERIEQFLRMSEASRGRSRRDGARAGVGPKPRPDYQGNGSMSAAEQELEQVEEELEDDD